MSDVSAVIEREIELTSRFVDLLVEEQEILKVGDIAGLTALTDRKPPFIEQLNALSRQRVALLGLAPEVAERDAMQQWLSIHGDDQSAAVNWEKLLKLAREAKALHELNAQLVDLHLRQTSEILNILTQPSTGSALYGASGQSVPSTGSRIVDSA